MNVNLPNFICPGAQKSGTTTLYHILKNHPDVYLSDKKEIHYFDKNENYRKGLKWYLSQFPNKSNRKIIGEITPDYMVYDYVADRISEALGKNIKIIILLRNPIDRAYSQYNHHRQLGLETNNNFAHILKNEKIIEKINSRKTWYDPPYYLSKGFYYQKIKKYYDIFGMGNVHITIFEDLFIQKNNNEFKKIFEFLNVSPLGEEYLDIKSNRNLIPNHKRMTGLLKKCENKVMRNRDYHSISGYSKLRKLAIKLLTKGPQKIDLGLKNELIKKIFIHDIKRLEKLTGINFSIWYNFE